MQQTRYAWHSRQWGSRTLDGGVGVCGVGGGGGWPAPHGESEGLETLRGGKEFAVPVLQLLHGCPLNGGSIVLRSDLGQFVG